MLPNYDVEFSQLRAGQFSADCGVLKLDAATISQFAIDQPLHHRGSPPHGCSCVLFPGAGSRAAFALGKQVGLGQCLSIAEGSWLDAITRDRYVSVVLAVDRDVWTRHAHWLDECVPASSRGSRVENPGPQWVERMQRTVE